MKLKYFLEVLKLKPSQRYSVNLWGENYTKIDRYDREVILYWYNEDRKEFIFRIK